MPCDEDSRITPCPICGANANISGTNDQSMNQSVRCLRCGDFVGSYELCEDWPRAEGRNRKKVAIASHIIRQLQDQNNPPKFTRAKLQRLLKDRLLPYPLEVTFNLLLLVGDELREEPGKNFEDRARIRVASQIGAISADDVLYYGQALAR